MLHYQLEEGEPISGITTFAKRTTHYNGIIFSKGSPLINIFRKALLQLSEQGVIDQVLRRDGHFLVNKELDQKVLSIGQTLLAFLLLAGGTVSVCLVVMIEVLVWKYHGRTHSKQNTALM